MATFASAAATLGRIADAGNRGAEAAANAMADAFQAEVRRVLLAQRHPFQTRTPSVAPEPPAAISGRLAGSVTNTPAVELGAGEWTALSGPTTVYSRIQELGGWMQGHPEMKWWEDGVKYRSTGHSLPPRPYMLPVNERMSASGELTAVAQAEIQAAIDAAI